MDTPKQFTKQPRRKKEPVKRVTLSAEARATYEKEIAARAEREETYLRHLPSRDRK
ncbi:MAG: hypothetical protein JWR08_2330 [Enterovirga sp.]|nr:hypothetical protein [Enterovirga sp.]